METVMIMLVISVSIINASISNLIPTLLHENCDDVLIENKSIIIEVAHFYRLDWFGLIWLYQTQFRHWNSFGGLWHDFSNMRTKAEKIEFRKRNCNGLFPNLHTYFRQIIKNLCKFIDIFFHCVRSFGEFCILSLFVSLESNIVQRVIGVYSNNNWNRNSEYSHDVLTARSRPANGVNNFGHAHHIVCNLNGS